MRRTLLAALLCIVATPALAAAGNCPQGLRPATTAELFFAQDLAGGRVISYSDWRAFLVTELRPRFPTGLAADVYAVSQGKRNFRRQRSQGVFLVLTGAPDERQRLDLVRDAYSRRFHTDSALVVQQKACVAL